MTPLAPKTFDLGYRNTLNPDIRQGRADVVHFEWFNDGGHKLHGTQLPFLLPVLLPVLLPGGFELPLHYGLPTEFGNGPEGTSLKKWRKKKGPEGPNTHSKG
jgi:hypothetical protein